MMVKLTSSETGHVFMVNLDHVSKIYNHTKGGSVVVMVKNDEYIYVKESFDEIENIINRDKFLMSAMNGLLSNSGGVVQANHSSGTGWCNSSAEYLALWSSEIAQELLKVEL